MSKKLAVLVLILVAFICLGCTGGRVAQNGTAVDNATVNIWTCESIGDFQTNTDSDGIYTFNPFAPNSSMFDQSNYIPPGPIGIAVTGDVGNSFTRRNHQYDESCPIAYNDSTQNLPCKLQNIDFVDMTVPDFLAESIAFLEQDCGLEAKMAEQIGTSAVARIEGPLLLTSKPHAVSCVSQCTNSCVQQDIPFGESQSCMCICVEANCGTSFGPFCTEAGVPPDRGTVSPTSGPSDLMN